MFVNNSTESKSRVTNINVNGSCRCFFQASKQIFVKDIALSGSTISLISREGQGFTGKLVSTTNRKIKPAKTSNASNISGWYDFCQREQGYVQIKLQRIPGIHRATAITCDPEGRNFAAIQVPLRFITGPFRKRSIEL